MTILAATDLSDNSKAAIRSAAHLAERRNSELGILYCEELADPDAPWRTFIATPWEEPQKLKEKARRRLDTFVDETLEDLELSVTVNPRVEIDSLQDTLARLGDDRDIDLLVLGSTGANALARFLLGSSAEEVIRQVDFPVLVVPPEGELEAVQTILAPVDLSDCSRASLQLAADTARDFGASVHVLRALPIPTTAMVPYETEVPPVDFETYQSESRRGLETFIESVDTTGLELKLEQLIEAPAPAILQYAEDHDVDLIVMGTHGRRGIDRFFLGSTATKVLRRLPCPVMTYRHTEESSSDEPTS